MVWRKKKEVLEGIDKGQDMDIEKKLVAVEKAMGLVYSAEDVYQRKEFVEILLKCVKNLPMDELKCLMQAPHRSCSSEDRAGSKHGLLDNHLERESPKRGSQPIECPYCFALFSFDSFEKVHDGLHGELVKCQECNSPLELYVGAIIPDLSLGEMDNWEFEDDDNRCDPNYQHERDYKRDEDISYDEAKALMEEMAKSVSMYDMILRRKGRVITVEHLDGTKLEFHTACYRKVHHYWVAIFTEHHGDHLYHIDDLLKITQHYDGIHLFYQEF
jgi:hypothetical protein